MFSEFSYFGRPKIVCNERIHGYDVDTNVDCSRPIYIYIPVHYLYSLDIETTTIAQIVVHHYAYNRFHKVINKAIMVKLIFQLEIFLIIYKATIIHNVFINMIRNS